MPLEHLIRAAGVETNWKFVPKQSHEHKKPVKMANISET